MFEVSTVIENMLIKSLPFDVVICTIDESIKGAASLGRYGITFDGNIDVVYNFQWLSIYNIYPYLKNGREVTISKMFKSSLLTKKKCSTRNYSKVTNIFC